MIGMYQDLSGQEGPLQLASDIWPPFTNVTDEKSVALDLVNEALDRIGYEAEVSIIPFNEALTGLQDGSFDGSSAVWRTLEREAFLVFSDPYLENQLILVGTKGSDVSADKLSDLKGFRVGIVGSYAYGEGLDTLSGVEFVPGSNDQENLNRLIAGDIDYMLADDLLIQYLLANQSSEVSEFLAIGETALLRRSLHFAIRKDYPNALGILEAFNREIFEMISDGSYNRILELDWIRADVDGDGLPELVPAENKAGEFAPKTSYDVLFSENNPSYPGPGNLYDRYYIDGKVYNGWETVPKEYKKPYVSKSDLDRSGFGLKFGF